MRKTFVSNLILVVFLNLLVKPLAIFGIDAEVQNRVGPEEFGLYFSLVNFTYLFNIILDLGITNYNTKHVAQYPTLVKRYMGKILPFRLFLFVVYVLLTGLFALVIGYDFLQFEFLGLLVLTQFLVSTIAFGRSYLSGLHLFKLDILFSVLDKFLLILVAGGALYLPQFTGQFNLTMFVWIQVLSLSFSVVLLSIIVFRKVGLPRIKWSRVFNLAIFRESYPYALLIFLMMLYNRIDAVMIERLLGGNIGKHEAGIYAQAFRLLDATLMFGMLFTNLLFPMFARQIKERISIQPLLEIASRLLFTIAIVIAALCFHYSEELLGLIYENNLQETSPIFQMLMLSFIPISVILLLGTLLTANGSLKTLNFLSLSALFLNVILNAFFIPIWKAEGAALASILTQGSLALIYFYFLLKEFQLKIHFKLLISFCCLAILVFCLPIVLKINLIWILVIFSIISLSIHINEIRNILSIVKKLKADRR